MTHTKEPTVPVTWSEAFAKIDALEAEIAALKQQRDELWETLNFLHHDVCYRISDDDPRIDRPDSLTFDKVEAALAKCK